MKHGHWGTSDEKTTDIGMDDKELYERTLAVIDSQYKIYLRKGNILEFK